jgi:hypothetical protein
MLILTKQFPTKTVQKDSITFAGYNKFKMPILMRHVTFIYPKIVVKPFRQNCSIAPNGSVITVCQKPLGLYSFETAEYNTNKLF